MSTTRRGTVGAGRVHGSPGRARVATISACRYRLTRHQVRRSRLRLGGENLDRWRCALPLSAFAYFAHARCNLVRSEQEQSS